MIDANTTLRTYLSNQSALTALTSTRLWPGRTFPPEDYDPGDGAGIAFRSRGGPGLDFSRQVLRLSMQMKCYAANKYDANTLYRTLVDVLDDKRGDGIRQALLDVPGQTLEEQDTGWPYVLVFFDIWLLSAVAA